MKSFFTVTSGMVALAAQAQSFAPDALPYAPLPESTVAQVQPAADSRPVKPERADTVKSPGVVSSNGAKIPAAVATKKAPSPRQDRDVKYIRRGCSSQEQALALCSPDEQ